MWSLVQLIVGISLGIIAGYASYRLGALNAGGAAAAALVGGLVFGLGGFPWAVLLLTFFISSSLLSRAFAARKAALNEKFAKGSRRDYAQVLANGGLGALLSVAYWVFPTQIVLWIAFAGALAAVNADTWGTELGVLSQSPPRIISSWRVADRGTSGAVTLVGYMASLAGAALIALAALFFTPSPYWLALFLIVVSGGIIGATVDSILGATVQGIYYCPQCAKETESHPLHRCGTPTLHIRGWRWLNNDLVNFVCSVVGAGVAAAGWLLFV